MKTLTISIAAYNMEKYIAKTLSSLIDEDVIDELEVFVVDDGGSDKTLEIARDYAARFPASIIPIHKENGGYGTTVNYSISHATGRYFKCLDGDDWFDSEGLVKLVRELKMSESDVVVTPHFFGPEGGTMRLGAVRREGNSDEMLISQMKLKSIPPIGMWDIAYRTEMLKCSGLNMPAHTLYSDQYFATIPFATAKTIRFLNFPVYCYRVGRDGQSVTRDSRMGHKQEMLDICRELCKFSEEQRKSNAINYQYILHKAAGYHLTAYRTIILGPVCVKTLKELKRYEKECRDIARNVYKYSVRMRVTSSRVLRVFRITGYAAYWLLKFLPGGAPNF